MKTTKNSKTATGGKVQIIGGRWRRTRLAVTDAEGLRPTGNRIRETLFNWLMPFIQDAVCLDLFAGTGSLGFEALSRGAAFVQFVETNPKALRTLEQNLKSVGAAAEAQLAHQDALQFLVSQQKKHFDIVFLDPPFQNQLWQKSIDLLDQAQVLASDALIYVESPRETKICVPASWHEHRTLNAGKINATLYTYSEA